MGIFAWFFDFLYRTFVLFEGFRKQREEDRNAKKNDKQSVQETISEYTNLHEKEEADRTDNYQRYS